MGALPGREAMREVALRSVEQQIDVAHVPVVLGVDHAGIGCGAMKNAGIGRATADWVAFLDDDDFYFPRHLRTLLDHHRDADIVYSLPLIWRGPRQTIPWPASPFDPERLRFENYIPCGYMVRRELAVAVGGFPPRTPEVPYQDWGFLLRMLDAGARFHYVEAWTWAFRWHDGNTSSFGKHPDLSVPQTSDYSTSEPRSTLRP